MGSGLGSWVMGWDFDQSFIPEGGTSPHYNFNALYEGRFGVRTFQRRELGIV
jgi:hypothetical protein